MNEKDLVVIKSRTLLLKSGAQSSEILLADQEGGDSFLTFELRNIGDTASGGTDWTVSDPHHASFIIDIRPNAITRPQEPILIGTYGAKNAPLYLGFVVQPQIGDSGEHETTITFYIRKEVTDGSYKQ